MINKACFNLDCNLLIIKSSLPEAGSFLLYIFSYVDKQEHYFNLLIIICDPILLLQNANHSLQPGNELV